MFRTAKYSRSRKYHRSEMTYIAERDAAVEAAVRAASSIRQSAGRLASGEVMNKGVHDLVTVADLEAQKRIVSFLGDAFPAYGFLAEEETEESRSYDERGYMWIIDPIDGTTNFTHGLPPYAISIGLRHKGRMVVGVVLEIARNELFTATLDGGSYLNGKRIQIRPEIQLERALVTTGFPYREFHYLDDYLAVLSDFMRSTQGVRRPGASSVDLAYLSAGRFDGFFELGLSPWDVAAGSLIVQEAGGRVTDFSGGDNFLFGGQLLASNGVLHDQMLSKVSALRRYAMDRRF